MKNPTKDCAAGKEVITVSKEINDLSLQVDSLLDKSDTFTQIFTRGGDKDAKNLVEFKTMNDKTLAVIAERMPEINRATNVFGKKNSQVTGKLMTLNMISTGPYRRIKQCLAQIERKRGALKENIFKLRKDKVRLDRLQYKKEQLQRKIIASGENEILNPRTGDPHDPIMLSFDLEELEISIQNKAANIADTTLYIEGALKEIGMYQESYLEIKESNDIPDNWDESDYEEEEVGEHVKTAFLHVIRDVENSGRLNVGTHEYLEQFGINPHTALVMVKSYLANTDKMSEGETISINALYDFLDKMFDMFGQEYKKAMERLGIKNLVSGDFLFKDHHKKN